MTPITHLVTPLSQAQNTLLRLDFHELSLLLGYREAGMTPFRLCVGCFPYDGPIPTVWVLGTYPLADSLNTMLLPENPGRFSIDRDSSRVQESWKLNAPYSIPCEPKDWLPALASPSEAIRKAW